ncbi:MAG TPA: PP2C family protein-serine/threonine phosphatase [Acidobacteriaceae bacterium]|nr:PP2C family protein-serine/threonine phosphatase [Acidobacteriaceae bacterium]
MPSRPRLHTFISIPQETLLIRRLVCTSLLALGCAAALAQSSPATPISTQQISIGRSVVALYGPWKFHPGDSPLVPATHAPLWATPAFDDASWETVDLTPEAGSFDPVAGYSGFVPGWTRRGHRNLWGYAWYRIHVRVVAPPGEKLALSGPADIDDVYELFSNGNLVGSFGDFSHSRPTVYFTQPMMFPVSAAANSGALDMVIAVRVWMESFTLSTTPDAGGMHTAPMLGELSAITAENQMRWLELLRAYAPRPVETVLFVIIAIVAFSLTLFDRSDRAYLWTGIAFLISSAITAFSVIGSWTQWIGYRTGNVIVDVFLYGSSWIAWTMVWWAWFRLSRPAWLPRALAVLTPLCMVSILLAENLLFILSPGMTTALHDATIVLRILLLSLFILVVVQGIRLRGLAGWLVVPPALCVCISTFTSELGVLHIRTIWFPFGVQVTIGDLSRFLMIGTLGVLLLQRLLTSVREQRRLALDIKQAQEVQQVILPQPRSVFPGLIVESEYRPALDVGGDFFQIIPHASDGSLLIVAGDVTGKGLKAGMLVALLVGAMRSTVEATNDPRAILEALNRRLLGRGDAHATCLVLRIAADGSVSLANAGHMPPYLNGDPLPVDGALPLGLSPATDFSSMRFNLAEGDRLVLISDGIVEATDAEHHLYGFDRTHQLLRTTASASAIAATAQSWGQEDDISVISVTRTTWEGHLDRLSGLISQSGD